MTYAEVIQNRILFLCEKRKISINKLASMSGLTQSTLDSVVRGVTKNPTLRTLHKVATGFSMTVSEFLDFPEMNEELFEDSGE
ncbi:helix-turn-helix domain-containing protein [Anaeromassilibacillus senegalensis]|uniref:helix-turn-helix domain-containing protein n=1 Tax=Anaeromassilibacillus senegalensis TaxID=1673717 RepID=UPI0006835E3F|nr:helix-turn-helix domain-containing protein [Anaeromassilibacillus senegalensis]